MSLPKPQTRLRYILQNQLIDPFLRPGQILEITKEQEPDLLFQLEIVLRAKAGQQIVLINLGNTAKNNVEFSFIITSLNRHSLKLSHLGQHTLTNELPHQLILSVCLPNKPAKLDFLIEKAVELGVTQFYLINSEYSQFSHNLRLDRLQKIIKEAVEQSERGVVPILQAFSSFDSFLLEVEKLSFNKLIALERSPQSASLFQINKLDDTMILIGPEGGFSSTEIEKAKTSFQVVSLGGTILRQETACILSLGFLQYLLSN